MSKDTDRLLIKNALSGQARPAGGSGIVIPVQNEKGETLGTMPIEVAQVQQLQRIAFALEAIAGMLEHVSVILAPQAEQQELPFDETGDPALD